MIMISKFLFNFSNFYVITCFFLTMLLVLGILSSTAVNVAFVAKSPIPDILHYFDNFRIVICLFNKTTSIRNFLF